MPLSAAAQLWMSWVRVWCERPAKVEEAGQLRQIQRAAQIGDALGAQAVGQASEGLLQGLRTEEGGERFVVEQALVQPPDRPRRNG